MGRIDELSALPLTPRGGDAILNTFQEKYLAAATDRSVLPLVLWDPEDVARVSAPDADALAWPREAIINHFLGARSRGFEAEASYSVPTPMVPGTNVDAHAASGDNHVVASVIEILLSYNIQVSLADVLFGFTWTIPVDSGLGVLTEALPNTAQQANFEVTTGNFRVSWHRASLRRDAGNQQKQTAVYVIPYFTQRGIPVASPIMASESGAGTPKPLRLTLQAAPPGMNIQVRGLSANTDFVRSVMNVVGAR